MTKTWLLLTSFLTTTIAISAFATANSELASAYAGSARSGIKCGCPDVRGQCDFSGSQSLIREKLDGRYRPEIGYYGTVNYCGESHDITFYFEEGPMRSLQASYKVGPFGKTFPACIAPDPENDKDVRMFLLSAMPPCSNGERAPEKSFVTLKKSARGTISMIGSKGEVSIFRRPVQQTYEYQKIQTQQTTVTW